MSFTRPRMRHRLMCLVLLGVTPVLGRVEEAGAQSGPSRMYLPTVMNSPAVNQIGSWRERILNPDGSMNWTEWEAVASAYHTEAVIDWRLGPTYNDLYGTTPTTAPLVSGLDPDGLFRGGLDPALAQRFCVTSDRLPRNEQEESELYDEGGAWMMAGQMLFVPAASAAPTFRFGSANVRGFDGAMARLRNGQGVMDTRALCMRMRAEWTPDWWNRNAISTPATPEVEAAVSADATIPLPAVAHARSRGGAAQVGFVAFQNGLILPVTTGNNSGDTPASFRVQLPPGKVPTALAVSPYNEFLFVTVWDVPARRGQLAVIALKPRQMAGDVDRSNWGLPGAWIVTGMKLLGFIDLPVAAPIAIDVSTHLRMGNPRGITDNEGAAGDFALQATRDLWRSYGWESTQGEALWRQTAQAGYAAIASRAENKVVLVDLGPLFRYYREMVLTTQSNYDSTTSEGPAPGQWPFDFAFAPRQRPVVVGSLDITQPTAVLAGLRGVSAKSSLPVGRAWDNGLTPLKTLYVATLDGTLRLYDVKDLAYPGRAPALPGAPFRSVTVGRNPIALYSGAYATASDDVLVLARAERSLHYLNFDGSTRGVLRDRRWVDPVGFSIGWNGAGFGGQGPDRTMYANVITILDFDGQQLLDYAVADGINQSGEQWPFLDASGNPVTFLFGYANPFPGKPFLFTQDEVI